MDVTPSYLRDAEIRERFRGYDQDDVDQLLEQAAFALEQIELKVRDAQERAERAERRLVDQVSDDEVRRTLILAQRTAEATTREAEAEAAVVIADAEARSAEMVAAAEQRIAALEAEIVERHNRELGDLAAQRAALQADVDGLSAFVTSYRRRLRDELSDQIAWLDDPARVEQLSSPPMRAPEPTLALAAVDVPAPVDDDTDDNDESEDADAAPVSEGDRGLDVGADRLAVVPDVAYDAEPRWSDDDDLPQAEETTGQQAALVLDDEAGDDEADDDGPAPVVDLLEREEPETSHPDEVDVDASLDGDEDEADDSAGWLEAAAETDPFLAELRRAVTDEEPLGPRDDDDPPLDLTGLDNRGAPSARFRRRRRR